MSKGYIETFHSEQDVLRKIEDLKLQGYKEEDMYVVARDKDELSLVRGRTDADVESVEGNWWDKFKAFVSGDSSVREAFDRMGMEKEDSERYYDEVRNGAFLLYADNEYADSDDRYMRSGNSLPLEDRNAEHKVTGTNFTAENDRYVDPNLDNPEPTRPVNDHHEKTAAVPNEIENDDREYRAEGDRGKILEPSEHDKQQFGGGTHDSISSDAVDAGTPRGAMRPDQPNYQGDPSEPYRHREVEPNESTSGSNRKVVDGQESVWVDRTQENSNRHVDAETDDKNRLYGGQPVSDENPNEYHHQDEENKKYARDARSKAAETRANMEGRRPL
ncbi:general stress protein [Jeotgalibacillus sp. R-1-5s-1]|uniref:general stress protein n=1 Tax=Jeotgalibacillus sp. R-1-5s-1 TaxID=2555897 RepID=UPI00141BA783|nr:general stress protein [Jeotgalibacillus sp. R-1-5s-1]